MHTRIRPRRYYAAVTAVLGTFMATSGCAGLAEGQTTVNVRQAAPDIALSDQHNQAVSLRNLTARGPVLVVFYRGHW